MENPPENVTRSTTIFQPSVILSVIKNSYVVKGASAALLLFYCLSFIDTVFDHLCVVPGYVLPPNFWVWTLLTHNFLQSHILMVVVDICVVIMSGKIIEPLWSPLQIGIFFAVVTSSAALITAGFYVIFYYVTGNTDYLFETHIHGLGAYIDVPLICLSIAITLSACGVLNGPYAIHFGFGVLISWIYLRFYQKHGNGNTGDMAEEFSFARCVRS